MDDLFLQNNDWDAGFEADRRIVISRLGPFVRVFARPRHFVPHFYHEIYNLGIQDWVIPIAPFSLGKICTIKTDLAIRFQSTFNYAKEHLEFLPKLNDQIKTSHLSLVKDLTEQELQKMALDPAWIAEGHELIEKKIENALNETLAIRDIQCRSRCKIEVDYASLEEIEAETPSPWAKHQAVYLDLLKRQRQAYALSQKQKSEQIIHEQSLKLEHEKELLQLAQKEDELYQIQQNREVQRFKIKLETEEKLKAEQHDSEVRLCEEQIRHNAHLNQLEMDAEFEALNRKEQNIAASEHKLKLNKDAQLFELAQKEAEARRIQIQWQADQQKAEWAAEQAREAERRQNEIVQHEENVRHQAHLKKIEMEIAFEAELQRERANISNEHKLKLEREAMLFALKEQEEELRKAQRAREIERIHAERIENERLEAEQHESEAKLREAQIRHVAHLRELERNAEFEEKNRHSQSIAEMELHLTREIELLALERQRLLLEEEVREIKASKSKGLIIDAKKPLSLGELEQHDPRS